MTSCKSALNLSLLKSTGSALRWRWLHNSQARGCLLWHLCPYIAEHMQRGDKLTHHVLHDLRRRLDLVDGAWRPNPSLSASKPIKASTEISTAQVARLDSPDVGRLCANDGSPMFCPAAELSRSGSHSSTPRLSTQKPSGVGLVSFGFLPYFSAFLRTTTNRMSSAANFWAPGLRASKLPGVRGRQVAAVRGEGERG